jgi:hypothetical protein
LDCGDEGIVLLWGYLLVALVGFYFYFVFMVAAVYAIFLFEGIWGKVG